MTSSGTVERVKRAAAKRLLFLPHAVRQMTRTERMITPGEVRAIIEYGELIEDYPEDARGQSCLPHGRGDGGREVHVVCSPKEDYLAVITVYLLRRMNGRETCARGRQHGVPAL